MVKIKTFNLEPTIFKLDLIYYDNDRNSMSNLLKLYKSRYGIVDKEEDFWYKNHVSTIKSGEDSKLEGETVISMFITNSDLGVLVHECMHVLFHLYKCAGIEIDYEAQEWCAIFIEKVFNDVSKFLINK